MQSQRSALTLLELVVTMSITAIILTGLLSATLLATQALPQSADPVQRSLDVGEVTHQLAGDLYYATSFLATSETLIEFKVPDRNGDLATETIQYRWSGPPGGALIRSYNGADSQVLPKLTSFHLEYLTRSVTIPESTETKVKTEDKFANFGGWTDLTPTVAYLPVNSVKWAAEWFTVKGVPVDATRVEINRVRLSVRRGTLGGSGTITVAIHRPLASDNPEPNLAPIGTPATVSTSLLSASADWFDFVFSDVVLDVDDLNLVIVVRGTSPAGSNSDADIVRYYHSAAPADDSLALWTLDGGVKYDPKDSEKDDYGLPFRVEGFWETTQVSTAPVTRHYLTGVDLALQAGDQPLGAVYTALQVVNTPEVAEP